LCSERDHAVQLLRAVGCVTYRVEHRECGGRASIVIKADDRLVLFVDMPDEVLPRGLCRDQNESVARRDTALGRGSTIRFTL
jgi:hypothetical protein